MEHPNPECRCGGTYYSRIFEKGDDETLRPVGYECIECGAKQIKRPDNRSDA